MHTIGFYNGHGFVDARNPFLAAVLAGLHFQSDYHECDLLFHRVSRRGDQQNQIREIISGKVDGVILYTEPEDPLVEMLVAQKFPAVAIADADPRVPSVTADDVMGSKIAARRLAAAGHKRVLFRMAPIPRASAVVRCRSFEAEAAALGMHVDVTTCVDFAGTLHESEKELLTAPDGIRPTGVMGWNDGAALETFMHFYYLKRADQCSVIGFDGFDHPWLPARLTSIEVPWYTVASTAVDVLRNLIAGEPVKRHSTVPVKLREGNTG